MSFCKVIMRFWHFLICCVCLCRCLCVILQKEQSLSPILFLHTVIKNLMFYQLLVLPVIFNTPGSYWYSCFIVLNSDFPFGLSDSRDIRQFTSVIFLHCFQSRNHHPHHRAWHQEIGESPMTQDDVVYMSARLVVRCPLCGPRFTMDALVFVCVVQQHSGSCA